MGRFLETSFLSLGFWHWLANGVMRIANPYSKLRRIANPPQRTLCDTDFWSGWSDTVQFHVPMHHVGDTTGGDTTGNGITLAEQYTYLMPNPAREEVAVMSSFREKALELYGADGKLLQRKEVDAVGTTLDLKGLPAGIYFVRVVTHAGVTTKRLVIE